MKTKLTVVALAFALAAGRYAWMKQERQLEIRMAPNSSQVESTANNSRSSPQALSARSVASAQLASKPAERLAMPNARGEPISVEDEEAKVAAGLATLERLRKLPEAAPLVDEIVAFIKNDRYNEFSIENIPTDKNGLATLDEHTTEHMIRNEEIRQKWDRLMKIVAEHPEVMHADAQPHHL